MLLHSRIENLKINTIIQVKIILWVCCISSKNICLAKKIKMIRMGLSHRKTNHLQGHNVAVCLHTFNPHKLMKLLPIGIIMSFTHFLSPIATESEGLITVTIFLVSGKKQ